MKKFLAVFDPLHFMESTMAYAVYMARHTDAHLVGIFLEDIHRHSYSPSTLLQHEGASPEQQVHELNRKDDETRNAAVSAFQHACSASGVPCSVHRHRDRPLQELLHESIYADLLFISPTETLERAKELPPTTFIRHLLEEVQCPVLLVPTAYKVINRIALLYDGEPSSVYALRTFSYLFEKMKSLPTEVITAKPKDDDLHLPDPQLIKEFVRRHFPEAHYTVLSGPPETSIIRHLLPGSMTPLIVLGAYRRTRISRLFRPSMADALLEELRHPMFIAHNRS